MSAPRDSTLADSEQLIADLQRQLAECRAERAEARAPADRDRRSAGRNRFLARASWQPVTPSPSMGEGGGGVMPRTDPW